MAFVCRAVASLRSEPCTLSELITQELFGRHVTVEGARGDWIRCVVSDGYRGWLPVSSLCHDPSFEPSHVVVRRFARLRLDSGSDMFLPMGSRLEVKGTSARHHAVSVPCGAGGRISRQSVGSLSSLPWKIGRFDFACREVIGTPYLWGGKSTFGFDCSGLVQFVFEFFGKCLPRDSADQAERGRLISDVTNLEPYDLIFFKRDGAIVHVAIHLGEMRILHASGRVRVESLDAESVCYRPDLFDMYSHARRILHV